MSLLEKKLAATEDEQRKREEERLQTEKTLRDIKNSQILLNEKHKEALNLYIDDSSKMTRQKFDLEFEAKS